MEGWYHHSRGSNDWDLNAVVRYACGGRVSPPTSSGDPFSSFFPPPPPQQEVKDDALPQVATSLPDDLPFNGDAAVLDELSIAFFGVSARPGPPQPQQQQLAAARDEETLQPQQDDAAPPSAPQTSGRQASGGEGSRSKRKKKQVKKVVKRVAADGVSADPWAWRKYGQKPIKGSPYPRGYYRCSTDKACAARKMVERCRNDPDSFILTYTGGDHSHPVPIHRNSLAGTTRIRQQRAEPPSCGQSAPGGATATAEPSPGQSTSGGMSTSPTTSPRSPSMEEECNQEEAECDEAGGASKDVEMAGEEDDELKTFLGTYDQPAMVVDGGVSSRHARMDDDDGAAARVSPLLNVVEETFVISPWVTALGDATGWS